MAEIFAVHRGCFAAVIVVEVVVALVRQFRLVYEFVHLGHRVPPPGGCGNLVQIMACGLNAKARLDGRAFLLCSYSFKYTGWSISSMPIKFGGDVVCLLSVVRNWGTGGA